MLSRSHPAKISVWTHKNVLAVAAAVSVRKMAECIHKQLYPVIGWCACLLDFDYLHIRHGVITKVITGEHL